MFWFCKNCPSVSKLSIHVAKVNALNFERIFSWRNDRSSKPTTNKISRLSERQPIKKVSERPPIEFLWMEDQSYLQHYWILLFDFLKIVHLWIRVSLCHSSSAQLRLQCFFSVNNLFIFNFKIFKISQFLKNQIAKFSSVGDSSGLLPTKIILAVFQIALWFYWLSVLMIYRIVKRIFVWNSDYCFVIFRNTEREETRKNKKFLQSLASACTDCI